MTSNDTSFSAEALRQGLARYSHNPESILMSQPFKHDASYDYVCATAEAYANHFHEIPELGYQDVDLFYFLTVDVCHRTKLSKMRDSHLPNPVKQELESKYSEIFLRWENHKYENKAESGNIGFFHRSFGSFDKGPKGHGLPREDIPRFMQVIVGAYLANSAEDAIDCVRELIGDGLKGVGSGSLSQILHLLHPEYFPILNAHEGRDSIFYALGAVKKKGDLKNVAKYADCCDAIGGWRDEYYPEIRNYRIFDLVAKNLPRIHAKLEQEPTDPLENTTIEERFLAAKALFEADDPFCSIRRLSNKLNIFEVLKITRTEIRHSNMIAWLLDPNENHGLGDRFLRLFLKDIGDDEAAAATSDELRSFEVYRERKHIDLLLVSNTLKRAIAIENKTFTGEHDRQLERYADSVDEMYGDYRKRYVYLTPNADMSSDPGKWMNLGYEAIVNAVQDSVAQCDPTLSEDAKVFINHYIETIRRDIMGEDELAELCRKFYRENKLALDVIYNYRSDDVSDTCDLIKGWLEQNVDAASGLRLASNSKGLIRFGSLLLDEICGRLQDGAGQFKDGSLCNFGFAVSDKTTYLYFTYPVSDAMSNEQIDIRFKLIEAETGNSPNGKTWAPRLGWEKETNQLLEFDDQELDIALNEAIEIAKEFSEGLSKHAYLQ